MRVISGSARGLRLRAPAGLETRPTADRIKETLFNVLAPDLYDLVFLDLFSGSGGIGIEALSRGAAHCVFVDNSPASREIITGNLKAARLSEKAEIMATDVFSALALIEKTGVSFDIIFMDPPYNSGLYEPVLEKILSSHILKKDGLIVVERSASLPPPDVTGYTLIKEKSFRTAVLTFLELED